MIDKLLTRFVYLTSLKVVALTLFILLGTPFFLMMSKDIDLAPRLVHSLTSGAMLSLPLLAILYNMRQDSRFWRLLGETRELLGEAQNISDLNWIRYGHFSDLQELLGSAKTTGANLNQVAELHRLQMDIEWKSQYFMSCNLDN